ncbi:guanine nucleotide binding protein, alpha subunit [Crucibulum laeve]|uniref:Guanine nucleotide binding protein, alpha subunit n=1 Tax=Crucibulum laeve TaxID=68775 RepID=A0A5C3MCH7_9AGAR|nr:guanine nucleotide binding protein, alpha subunit [Crucibulum laeve]
MIPLKKPSKSTRSSHWPPSPPKNETEEQRAERIRLAALAKRHSDSIDREIERERELRKGVICAKILLLGQAESGKSTVLKNFQLHFAPKAFAAEAEAWRPIIHLNLVRSVNFVLNFLSSRFPGLRDANPELHSNTELTFSDELRMLCARLVPLRQVEESLIKAVSTSESMPADVSKAQIYNPARASEVAIPSGTGWRKIHALKRYSSESKSRASNENPESRQNRCILGALGADISSLWRNTTIRRCLKSAEVRLEDQPGFFLDDVTRLTEDNYIPTTEDILKARVTTIGPEEHVIRSERNSETARDWIIYDLGGCRSHRAAWAQFFDDVNIVIFLAPISAFDQVLAEDESVNRLSDSISIWEEICKNKVLKQVEFVLFLNKCDIFESKIKSGVQFAQYHPAYTGKNEPESIAHYILRRFYAINKKHSRRRAIHPHLTRAVDIRATSKVITTIQEKILIKLLEMNSFI